MTVEEMLERMSGRELAEWMAFYRAEAAERDAELKRQRGRRGQQWGP